MVCRSYTVSFRPTFLASARVPPHSLLPLIADAALRVNSHDGRPSRARKCLRVALPNEPEVDTYPIASATSMSHGSQRTTLRL